MLLPVIRLYGRAHVYWLLFLPRDAMHKKRGLRRHAVSVRASVRLSVCPSVTFVYSVKMNKDIFEIFSPSGSHTILVFLCQTSWQYSDGNPPPNEGVECRWGKQKSRFWANIWLQCVLLPLPPARCCQYDAVGPSSRKLWHLAGSKGRCLLMAGKDGEMFMTKCFNVTLKTTEQHLIARCDKSVA